MMATEAECAGCGEHACARFVRMGEEVVPCAQVSDETVALCETCFQRDVRGYEEE